MKKRPHRSNSPLSIVRGIKTLKTIYWTSSRLRKLLPGVYSTARQEHFARAVKALKAWPERTPEQIIEEASRINPTRKKVWPKLMPGQNPDIAYRNDPTWTWVWPKSVATLMQEYAARAPEDAIDTDKLRQTLAGMDRRTRERYMEILVEELPAIKSPHDWSLLGAINRAHNLLMDAIRKDPDPNIREIDISKKAVIPGRWEGRHSEED